MIICAHSRPLAFDRSNHFLLKAVRVNVTYNVANIERIVLKGFNSFTFAKIILHRVKASLIDELFPHTFHIVFAFFFKICHTFLIFVSKCVKFIFPDIFASEEFHLL